MKNQSAVVFATLLACQPTVPAPPLVLDGSSELPSDAAAAVDASVVLLDAGVPRDQGVFSPPDAGERDDAGAVIRDPDAGGRPADASVGVADVGMQEPDAGVAAPDSGVVEVEDDHGDSLDEATDLDDERQASGRIEASGDEDYFIFRTGRAGRYRIYTTGNSDTVCALFTLDGDLLNENDDGGAGFNCEMVETLDANERYGVRVGLWNRERGGYTLRIEGPPPPPSVCGDARVEGREECDDGNENDQDACVNCREARCGDGVMRLDLQPGQPGHEFCDDGNDDAGDTCTTECTIPRCGDGYIWRGVEECDDGNDVDTDGCRLTCQVARCGDGVIFAGVEDCDDGNQVGGDGCGVRCDAEDVPEDCEAVQGRNRATIYCQTPRRTWAGAEAFCVEWGGHLLTVDDAADQRRLAAYGWRGDEMWIGLNDRDEEGEFVWVGRQSGYRNWSRGEPNNSGGSEHCAHLWRQGWGAWNDANCDQNFAFFCER